MVAVVVALTSAGGGRRSSVASSRALGPPRFARTLDVSAFAKGNLHTHSTVSDGDVPPEVVYAWYRDHGYAFVALTDHNTRVDPASYANLTSPSFTILAGEEITMSGAGKQVHVNGICIDEAIPGGDFATARAALDHAVGEIAKQNGVALINHPNFDWALKAGDIARTHGARLLEVWSGHPYVWTLGDDGRPSHEELWEEALSSGLDIAPAGVDDAHRFLPVVGDEKPALPGQAFVEVFGDDTSEQALCEHLRAGDVYASNGATIGRLRVTDRAITVWPSDHHAKVEFIGKDGKMLATVMTNADSLAEYALSGGESYVRARITDRSGRLAFTPAFFVTTDL